MKKIIQIFILFFALQIRFIESKNKIRQKLKQYENYETIRSSKVPLSYKITGDSVTINGKLTEQQQAEQQREEEKTDIRNQIKNILEGYQYKSPQSIQESQNREFDLKYSMNKIHNNVVFQPMSIADSQNKSNVIKVGDDQNIVNKENYMKLSGDPEYFNDYYSDYFNNYYKNLNSLRSPFLEEQENSADNKANRENIMRYFPLMYNVNYNDNLLKSSTTLFKVNDNLNSGMQLLHQGKGHLIIPKAETIVLPILQPTIQTVPMPNPCYEDFDDCVCPQQINNLFNQLKILKSCIVPPIPQKKCVLKKPCYKKLNSNLTNTNNNSTEIKNNTNNIDNNKVKMDNLASSDDQSDQDKDNKSKTNFYDNQFDDDAQPIQTIKKIKPRFQQINDPEVVKVIKIKPRFFRFKQKSNKQKYNIKKFNLSSKQQPENQQQAKNNDQNNQTSNSTNNQNSELEKKKKQICDINKQLQEMKQKPICKCRCKNKQEIQQQQQCNNQQQQQQNDIQQQQNGVEKQQEINQKEGIENNYNLDKLEQNTMNQYIN